MEKGCLQPGFIIFILVIGAIIYVMKESEKMSGTAQTLVSLLIFAAGFMYMVISKDKK